MIASDTRRTRPQDLIKHDAVEEYERRLDDLWLRWLLPAYEATHVARRILEFPPLMIPLKRVAFLDLIARTTIDQALLRVARSVDEPKNRTERTFTKIRRFALSHADHHKHAELERVLAFSSDDQMEERRTRATTLADKMIAHLDGDFLRASEKRNKLRFTFEDLESLVKETKRLLLRFYGDGGDGIFAASRVLVTEEYFAYEYCEANRDLYGPAPYPIPSGYGAQATIDVVLTNVARESEFLRMPEEQPELWEQYRASLADHERRDFNHWREATGLAPVDEWGE